MLTPADFSEVPVCHIRMAPQRHLQEARLDPRDVHFLDVLGGVPLLGEERLERKRHGEDQQEQVAEGHDLGRGRAVGAVLLRAVVAEADLVLVVQPLLVVLRSGCVEDPLTEALADGTQVVTERLAVATCASMVLPSTPGGLS